MRLSLEILKLLRRTLSKQIRLLLRIEFGLLRLASLLRLIRLVLMQLLVVVVMMVRAVSSMRQIFDHIVGDVITSIGLFMT